MRFYLGDEAAICATIKRLANVDDVKRWGCPCGEPDCLTAVLYARAADGKVWFESTLSAHAGPQYPVFAIENVEDLSMLLIDDRVHEGDRMLYAAWLAAGLRDALISAFEQNLPLPPRPGAPDQG